MPSLQTFTAHNKPFPEATYQVPKGQRLNTKIPPQGTATLKLRPFNRSFNFGVQDATPHNFQLACYHVFLEVQLLVCCVGNWTDLWAVERGFRSHLCRMPEFAHPQVWGGESWRTSKVGSLLGPQFRGLETMVFNRGSLARWDLWSTCLIECQVVTQISDAEYEVNGRRIRRSLKLEGDRSHL